MVRRRRLLLRPAPRGRPHGPAARALAGGAHAADRLRGRRAGPDRHDAHAHVPVPPPPSRQPCRKIPHEAAIDLIKENVILPLETNGLPTGVNLNLSGTADELTSTWNAMVINLLVAICMVYLLMAILFESFVYPLVIMLSVPPAAAGGVLGLWVLNLNTLQPLDMLTILGFVILIGIVVNNAILLVYQTLRHIKEEGLSASDAIIEATRDRIRPIFMSTLTSIFGMIPLVVFPGAGSELYRGLGSVIIGGLCLSAIITLAIVPPMLKIFIREGTYRTQHLNPALAK